MFVELVFFENVEIGVDFDINNILFVIIFGELN